jgi:hypothetical protein
MDKKKCIRKDVFGNCIYDKQVFTPSFSIHQGNTSSGKSKPINPKPVVPGGGGGGKKPVVPGGGGGGKKPVVPGGGGDKPVVPGGGGDKPVVPGGGGSDKPVGPGGGVVPGGGGGGGGDKPVAPDKNKKQKGDEGSGFLKRSAPGQPFGAKANGELTDEDIVRAKIVEAAKIYGDEGPSEAQKYLDQNEIKYTIDRDLSNRTGLVLIDDNNGDVKIAYRGTKMDNMEDWETNAKFARGEEKITKQYKLAKRQMEMVEEQLGKPTELLGYSKGGGMAITMGDEYRIPTTSFNPFISLNHIIDSLPRLITGERTTHNIIRTVNDGASLGLSATPRAWDVKTVPELKASSNPIDNHSHNNFLEKGGKQNENLVNKYTRDAWVKNKRIGEHIIQKKMIDDINDGKSFSQNVKEFSPADIDEDGDFSKRTSTYEKLWKEQGGEFTPEEQEKLREAKMTSDVDRGLDVDTTDLVNADVNEARDTPNVNNPFLTEEEKQVEMASTDLEPEDIKLQTDEQGIEPVNMKNPPLVSTEKQRKEFTNMTDEEQHDHIQKLAKDALDAQDNADTIAEGHEIQAKTLYQEAVENNAGMMSQAKAVIQDKLGNVGRKANEMAGDSLNPTNLAGGFMAGIVGNKTADWLDPNGENIHPVIHEGLAGGLTSGTAVVGSRLLSGGLKGLATTATAGELSAEIPAGAVGFVAGVETQKGLYKGLKKMGASENVAGSVSSAGGGAVGGVATQGSSLAMRKGGQMVAKKVAQSIASPTTETISEVEMMPNPTASAVESLPEVLPEVAEVAEGVGEATTLASEIASSTSIAESIAAFFAPETAGGSMLVAGGVGAIVGTGAFLANKYGGDIKQGAEKAVQGVETAGKTVVKGVETAGKAVEKVGSEAVQGVEKVGSEAVQGIKTGVRKVGKFFKHIF